MRAQPSSASFPLSLAVYSCTHWARIYPTLNPSNFSLRWSAVCLRKVPPQLICGRSALSRNEICTTGPKGENGSITFSSLSGAAHSKLSEPRVKSDCEMRNVCALMSAPARRSLSQRAFNVESLSGLGAFGGVRARARISQATSASLWPAARSYQKLMGSQWDWAAERESENVFASGMARLIIRRAIKTHPHPRAPFCPSRSSFPPAPLLRARDRKIIHFPPNNAITK